MNDIGTSLFDNSGMCEGQLLDQNDCGTSLYDMNGLPEGFIGTSTAAMPIRLMMGIGL